MKSGYQSDLEGASVAYRCGASFGAKLEVEDTLMASVSGPSDGGYSYYARRVADLEDDYEKERVKLREKSARTEAELADNYKAQREKDESRIRETQNLQRELSEQTHRRDLDNNLKESERVKKLYYDRMGKTNGLDAEGLREQVGRLEKQNEVITKKNQELMEGADTAYRRRVSELEEQHREKAETTIQRAREGIVEAQERRKMEQDLAYQGLQEKSHKAMDEAVMSASKQLAEERSRAKQAVETLKADSDRRLAIAQNTQERRADIHQRAMDDRALAQAEMLRESHEKNLQAMKTQQDELQAWKMNYSKEKGQGTYDALAEIGQQAKDRENALLDEKKGRDEQIARQNRASDAYWKHTIDEQAREKDQQLTRALARMGTEDRAQMVEQRNNFERSEKALKQQAVKDRETTQKAHDYQIDRQSKQGVEALEQQAKAFNQALSTQHESDAHRIAHVERELLRKTVAPEITDVSPAVEEAIRQSVMSEDGKRSKVEFERNRASETSMVRNFEQKIQDVVVAKDTANARMQREREGQHQMVKQELEGHVREIQVASGQQLRDKDIENAKLSESALRNYSLALDKQRREYEGMMETIQADSAARLASTRQEGEFQRRMEQRAFANRESELIRGYEREMEAQRRDFETKLDEMKEQAQTAIREKERTSKQMLEENARLSDQRLAAVEARHAERERATAQNYEDALEKVKNTNALLIKKKS